MRSSLAQLSGEVVGSKPRADGGRRFGRGGEPGCVAAQAREQFLIGLPESRLGAFQQVDCRLREPLVEIAVEEDDGKADVQRDGYDAHGHHAEDEFGLDPRSGLVLAALDIEFQQVPKDDEGQRQGPDHDAGGHRPQDERDGRILGPEVAEVQGSQPETDGQKRRQDNAGDEEG